MTTIFSESLYNQQYFEHFCDDNFTLIRYDKDKPFNQLRAEIFINNTWSPNQQWAQTRYMESRKQLQSVNRTLHKYFYDQNRTSIYNIVKDYTSADFITIPKQFRTIIKGARFLTSDGNSNMILLEGDNYYYLYHWGGS